MDSALIAYGAIVLQTRILFFPFCVQPDVEPGDVVIVVVEKEHNQFKRRGNDLYMEHTIGITEALCGFQFSLTHLDDRQLLIKYPPGKIIHPGESRM